MRHAETIPARTGRRIEQIGSADALPGVRRIEWHEADRPDGCFRRMPLPDIVCTINLGVTGRFRLAPEQAWQPFPSIAFRGIARAPSDGADPETGWIGYLSIVLAPWACHAYLGVPARALANRIVDGATLDTQWSALREQLAALPHARARLECVSRWMGNRARHAAWDARVAALLDAIRDDRRIADIAHAFGVSTRRVHQLCQQETGHNPSTYRQVARFARLAVALHAAGEPRQWSRHVGEYADHSHAIREFRRLASVTPRDYAASRPAAARTYSIVPQADAG